VALLLAQTELNHSPLGLWLNELAFTDDVASRSQDANNKTNRRASERASDWWPRWDMMDVKGGEICNG